MDHLWKEGSKYKKCNPTTPNSINMSGVISSRAQTYGSIGDRRRGSALGTPSPELLIKISQKRPNLTRISPRPLHRTHPNHQKAKIHFASYGKTARRPHPCSCIRSSSIQESILVRRRAFAHST